MKADISTVVTVIIIIIALFGSFFEKLLKARQTQVPPQPTPDFDTVDDANDAPQQTPAGLDDLIRKLQQMQGLPADMQSPVDRKEEPVHEILETIPTKPEQEVSHRLRAHSKNIPAQTTLEGFELEEYAEHGFDLRQAIVASEILNRKYA